MRLNTLNKHFYCTILNYRSIRRNLSDENKLNKKVERSVLLNQSIGQTFPTISLIVILLHLLNPIQIVEHLRVDIRKADLGAITTERGYSKQVPTIVHLTLETTATITLVGEQSN